MGPSRQPRAGAHAAARADQLAPTGWGSRPWTARSRPARTRGLAGRARAPSDPSNVGSIASSAAARWPDPSRARAAELRGCAAPALKAAPAARGRAPGQPPAAADTGPRARARSAPALPVLAPTPRRAPSRPHGARRSRADRAIGDPRGAACSPRAHATGRGDTAPAYQPRPGRGVLALLGGGGGAVRVLRGLSSSAAGGYSP